MRILKLFCDDLIIHSHFEDITETAGLYPPIDGNGAFWSDVNLDGYLDLFITDEHHPKAGEAQSL